MSSIVKSSWDWNVTVLDSADPVESMNVIYWGSDSAEHTTRTTDADGKFTASMVEATHTIDNVDDVTTTSVTPHTLSICKYGMVPKGLDIAFVAARVDTFYVTGNDYITEEDESVVADYTGIDIDHTNEKITITEEHSVDELYDYCQHDMIANPHKTLSAGVMQTMNGSDYILLYDLTIDGVSVSGSGKYIDMHTKELELLNDAGIGAKVLDVNGVLVAFSMTGLVANSEIRVYKEDDMSEVAGVEDSGESYTYNYNWTEDTPVVVVVYGVGYDPIRLHLTLSSKDNSIPIQQRKDRWYKNV